MAPSLTLTATDLSNGDGPISLSTGPIQVTPVNDAPTLITTPLVVAEGGTSTFTAANFQLADGDNLPEQVIYRITSLPGKGQLRLNGNPLVVGSTFSSSFVGSFTYTHDGSQVLPGGFPGSDSDAFTVSVDDGAGGLIPSATVPITLTPINQAPVVSGSIPVFEGQQGVPITLTISDADQVSGVPPTVVITSLPLRGTLRYNGTPITAPFTLPSLAGLTYDHDGNDLNGGFPRTRASASASATTAAARGPAVCSAVTPSSPWPSSGSTTTPPSLPTTRSSPPPAARSSPLRP